MIAGGGAVAGVGFTVSVLISSLAFDGRQLEEAKLGVLAAAIISSLVALVIFRVIRLIPAERRARQVAATYEDLLDLSEDVEPERDHVRGAEGAPVTLVEYGDYECPYCGRAEIVVRELLDSFGDDLRYVWRHLPLNDVHPDAQMAAEAAEAAGAQGAFWEMSDRLLQHQDQLTPSDLADMRRSWVWMWSASGTSSGVATTRVGSPTTSRRLTPAGWPARRASSSMGDVTRARMTSKPSPRP